MCIDAKRTITVNCDCGNSFKVLLLDENRLPETFKCPKCGKKANFNIHLARRKT
jgi:DNA-directed RNA polymerase subunit M/transcription elongation factor TFIIS